MRVIFAGTPVFAERAMAAILLAGHQVVLVLTRADKPAGRGHRLQMSPVKQLALHHGLAVLQPARLNDADLVQALANQAADIMVVAAYGRLLPAAVLGLPRLGCINIHASILPRWRGAAPIQRAIEAGDRETGVTIMQMDEGLDTGPMLLTRTMPIAPLDNAASVHDQLAQLGASAVVQALSALAVEGLPAHRQPESGITYAKKIEKSEAALDWRLGMQALTDKIRAFDPTPGCHSTLLRPSAETIKIWRVLPWPAAGEPDDIGRIRIDDGASVRVACADGWLRLLELQRPGGRRLAAAEFLHGAKIDGESRFAPY